LTALEAKHLRWTEGLFALLLIVSLAFLYIQSKTVGHLSDELSVFASEHALLKQDLIRTRDDVRRYQQVLGRSRLGSPVLLEGLTLDSVPTVIDLSASDRPILLYSIDPDCPACLSTLPFIQDLDTGRLCNVRVLGIGVNKMDTLDEFAKREHVGFPILRNSDGDAWRLFPLSASPATILIAPRGRVYGWWIGALSTAQQAEIRTLLANTCTARG
jgi:peroxiredoxin